MEIIKNRLRHFGELVTDSDMIEENLVVIVPDTKPDALQIIGASAWLNIQEKSCSQGLLKITGQANCCVSYLAAEGKTPHTVTASIPFSFTKEPEGMTDDDQLLANVRLLNTAAAMVNPRKLALRVQVQVFHRLFKGRSVEYAEEIRSDPGEGICCQRGKKQMQILAAIAEKRIVVNDEIRLSGDAPNENSVILRKESQWVSEDVRILPNKIMIRGRIDMGLTTMNEQGGFIGKSKYSVPFSQIVECDGVFPEDEVGISFAPSREEIELFTSADQVTTMTFSFAAVTECMIRKNMELAAVRDIYSTRWQMESDQTVIASPLEAACESVTLPVRESMMLEGSAERVLALSIQPEDGLIQKNETVMGAGFHVHLVYAETDGSIMTASKKLYVEAPCPHALPEAGWCQAAYADPTAELRGEGEAQICFDALLTCRENTGAPMRVVSDCRLNKNASKDTAQHPSLIVRTMEKEESVWELAKAYNTSPAILASANKLADEETVAAGRLVLIPFVHR